MFSRQSNKPEEDAVTVTPTEATAGIRGKTPAKGRPTPKRAVAQSRRPAEPPPANRREALKRSSAVRKADRAEQRAGMLSGDEKFLLPRDQGPERRLTRDLVDSRRNVGTWFFGAAFLSMIISLGGAGMPKIVGLGAQLLWLGVAVLFLIDSILLSRKISKMVGERFPKSEQRRPGLFMYGIMRSITFRKLRMPKPLVKIGDKI